MHRCIEHIQPRAEREKPTGRCLPLLMMPARCQPVFPLCAPVAQRCLNAQCQRCFGVREVLTACPACGELLDVVYNFAARSPDAASGNAVPLIAPASLPAYLRQAAARSATVGGVWCFKELLPFYVGDEGNGKNSERHIASAGEGRTILQPADALAKVMGFAPDSLFLQYEGFNPSGSFKDNGMTAGFTHARMVGAKVVACASTGNTSAALALYASLSGAKAVVFIGDGKIAFGKLSQALDYGALTLQIAGDFDACLARVREIAADPAAGVYLLNSVNPFRLEGQKTIMLRVLRDLFLHRAEREAPGSSHGGSVLAESRAIPDWIVVPGGNLGNCSAFAKMFIELRALRLIRKVPRLAVINARGSSTLDRVVNGLGIGWTPGRDALLESYARETPEPATNASVGTGASLVGTYDRERVRAEFERMDRAGERAHTIATAIEINRPVNLAKALRALWAMNGVVRAVSDDDILEHKALVGKHGFGCEPASAASVAGAALLRREGVIKPGETVACVLTGHQLKDPDATVTYHTGIDTKAAQEHIDARFVHEPSGRSSNRPIRVADDLAAIKRAMGIA